MVRRFVATLILATAIGSLAAAAPAFAHVQLVSTSPNSGATTTEPITVVTLVFSGPVQEQYTTVAVAAAGRSYSAGPSHVAEATVRQAVADLPSGEITVTWRTVATDGAPIQGSFVFISGSAGPSTEPGSDPPSAAAGTAKVSAPAVPTDTGAVLLIVAGSALLVAAALTLGWPWRHRLTTTIRRATWRT